MSKYDLGEEDLSLPLSPEMLRRRKSKGPTAEVPEALRPPVEQLRQPRQARLIARPTRTAADVVPPVPGYCPPWAGVAYALERVRLSAPPKVMRRGRRLEPRGDFEPRGDQQFYNDPVNYPWRCVCRITNTFGMVGSRALCGPRHVLTASHNVAWSSTTAEMIEVHRAGLPPAQAEVFATVALAYTQIEGASAPSDLLDEDYAAGHE